MSLTIGFKKVHEKAVLPTQAKPGDAGYDLCCVEDFILYPGQTYMVPTGLVVASWEVNERFANHFLQILSRSGLASKGIYVLGGVVDSGYRGEVRVLLHNGNFGAWSKVQPVTFKAGDKIAQAVVQCIMNDQLVSIKEVKEIEQTSRGDGGFGSTGA